MGRFPDEDADEHGRYLVGTHLVGRVDVPGERLQIGDLHPETNGSVPAVLVPPAPTT